MYQINNNKKFNLTIKAILVDSKQNKNVQSWTFVNKGENIIYFNMDKVYDACKFNYGFKSLLKSLSYNVNIDLNSFINCIDKKYINSLLTIVFTNHELIYCLPFKLTTNKKQEITHNYLLDKKYLTNLKEVNNLVEGFNFARKLQLMPSNYLNPAKFVDIAKKEFKQFANLVEIKVLSKKDIEAKKMGLLLGVNKGSNEEDSCRLLSIKLKNSKPKLAIIGKGITFDTGGINLKPTVALNNMQYDMSGAAVAIGMMLSCLKNKLKPNICVVTPLCANNISEHSTKVHDVLTAYNKTTVEVLNSDAEGRLILADAISYAINDLKVDSVATVATLTGAIVIALGENHTGYWTNNTQYIDLLNKASQYSGEGIWNMPLDKCFKDSMSPSLIADMSNDTPRDGASCSAASFLEIFAKNKDFIHFDIAATADYKLNGRVAPLPSMLTTLYYLVKDKYNGN